MEREKACLWPRDVQHLSSVEPRVCVFVLLADDIGAKNEQKQLITAVDGDGRDIRIFGEVL